MKRYCFCFVLFFVFSCGESDKSVVVNTVNEEEGISRSETSLVILGNVQDAGSPHIGCKKDCCKELFLNSGEKRLVVSLGLFDKNGGKKYLFEATPDMPLQMKILKNHGITNSSELADGIFLTHAHIGHYTGLMYLGKEAINAKEIPVYVMPKMKAFLEGNGPWSQLVTYDNISLFKLEDEQPIQLSEDITITPFRVPHRDEYSETVGYRIKGPSKTALFIPDIDKWEKWDKYIIEEIKKVDFAFIDGTFYSGEEINNRDISLIPHPFIIESMKKFGGLPKEEKNKIIFIHFNHTNPVLNINSIESKQVLQNGFRIARINDVYKL